MSDVNANAAEEVHNAVPADNGNNQAVNKQQEEAAALLNNEVNLEYEPILTDQHYDINGLLDYRVSNGWLQFYADWTEYSPDWQPHHCFLRSTLSDYYKKLVKEGRVTQFAELRALLARSQAAFVPTDRQYEGDLRRVWSRLGAAIAQLGRRRCQGDAERQALQREVAEAEQQHAAADRLLRALAPSNNQRQQADQGGSGGSKRRRGNVSTLNSKRRKN